MGNCNSSKKRDLKREHQIKETNTGGNQQKSSPQQNISKNGNQNSGNTDNSIPNSYTDRKLKEREYFKNLIERTQLKLIDVSQSPGGILDWGDDNNQIEAPIDAESKFASLPQLPICKPIFQLTGVGNSQFENAINLDLIRLEELDMMVSAMNLQEKKINSLLVTCPEQLVVQLEITHE